MIPKLAEPEVESRLKSLPIWTLKDGKLCRSLQFGSFVEAFAFMTAGAMEAEKLNHHPEWSNVYSKVEIKLQTHDSEGITHLDFTLAEKFEKLAHGMGAQA